jgi:hypothetical protein
MFMERVWNYDGAEVLLSIDSAAFCVLILYIFKKV